MVVRASADPACVTSGCVRESRCRRRRARLPVIPTCIRTRATACSRPRTNSATSATCWRRACAAAPPTRSASSCATSAASASARSARASSTCFSRRGYTVLITSSRDDPRLDVDRISLLEQRRVDGLLLLLAADDHEATLTRIRRLAVPFVLIDRDPPPGLACASVLCDHRGGARAAVEHLAGLGHTHIGLAAGPIARASGAGARGGHRRRGGRARYPGHGRDGRVQRPARGPGHDQAAGPRRPAVPPS